MTTATETLVGSKARPIEGDEWLGSQPVSLADLGQEQRTTLLYFWSYSSPHCLAMLPTIRSFQTVYGPHGLTVIGIHTPRFPFEADATHLRRALRDLEVSWPVIADTTHQVAAAYGNRYWPRLLLIAPNGSVVFDQIGVDEPVRLEEAIRTALHHAGQGTLSDPIRHSEHVHRFGASCYPTTPEFRPRETVVATTPLSVPFAATTVHAVLAPGDERTSRVRVRLNGQPVPSRARGDDLVSDGAEGIVALDYPRSYHLLASPHYLAPALLELAPLDGPFEVHAIMFGGCVLP